MDFSDFRKIHSRRLFLRDCAGGLGAIALGDLLERDGHRRGCRAPILWLPRRRTSRPRRRTSSSCFMEGAPSQLDLFDPKPELEKWHGKPLPASMTNHLKLAFIKPNAAVLASPRVFKPAGQSGARVLRFHSAHRVLRRRHLPGPLHVHGRVQSSSRPIAADDAAARRSGGRRWAHGCSTGSAANRRICRASWC